MSLRIAAFVVATIAVASLAAQGCLGPCNCPESGGQATVTLPAAQSSPISSVTSDGPCTAKVGSPDNIIVTTNTPGTCQVRVQLMSGDGYSFSVAFQSISSSCCGNLVGDHTVSIPEPVDAGG